MADLLRRYLLMLIVRSGELFSYLVDLCGVEVLQRDVPALRSAILLAPLTIIDGLAGLSCLPLCAYLRMAGDL